MSHLSCSLTVSVPDFLEPIASVRCMIHTDTGTIISGTRVSLPDTPSGQASSIGCAVEEMLSTLLRLATAITEDMEEEGDEKDIFGQIWSDD